MTLLDELIAAHDEGAVLTVRPYVPDSSGEILRWVVELDGKEPFDMDVRVEPDREDSRWIVMSLVRDEEELVVGRWPRRDHPEGAQVIWTLGGLRRWSAERFRGI